MQAVLCYEDSANDACLLPRSGTVTNAGTGLYRDHWMRNALHLQRQEVWYADKALCSVPAGAASSKSSDVTIHAGVGERHLHQRMLACSAHQYAMLVAAY